MANPTTPRLTPAELRKRLLSPPVDTGAATTQEESTPIPMPRAQTRRDNRYGSGSSQSSIDLEALVADVSPPQNPRVTPLPEARLDTKQFRTMQEPAPNQTPAYPTVPGSHFGDTDTLRAQNAELHRIVEEMKPLLEEATASEERFAEKETVLLSQMAERDNQIAELQASIKQLEEQLAAVPQQKTPKTRDELEEWSDELEQESVKIAQERRRMDEDRRQLREDEESLEKQMRDMEVAMARERAMIARQETELKRLSSEIQHELEVLQRGDGTLREQLSKFERRRQEVLSNAPRSSAPPPAPVHAPAPVPAPPVAPGTRDSGLLRRIFRGGK